MSQPPALHAPFGYRPPSSLLTECVRLRSYLVTDRAKVSVRGLCTGLKGNIELLEERASKKYRRQQHVALATVRKHAPTWLAKCGYTPDCAPYLDHRLNKRGDEMQRMALRLGHWIVKVLGRRPSLYGFARVRMSRREVQIIQHLTGDTTLCEGDHWVVGFITWRDWMTGSTYAFNSKRNVANVAMHLAYLLPESVQRRSSSSHGLAVQEAREALEAAQDECMDGEGWRSPSDAWEAERRVELAQQDLEAALAEAGTNEELHKHDRAVMADSLSDGRRVSAEYRARVRRERRDGTLAQRKLLSGRFPVAGYCGWVWVMLAACLTWCSPAFCAKVLAWQERAAAAEEAGETPPDPPAGATELSHAQKCLLLATLGLVGPPLRVENLLALRSGDLIVESDEDGNTVCVRLFLSPDAHYKTEESGAKRHPFAYEYPHQLGYLAAVANACRAGLVRLREVSELKQRRSGGDQRGKRAAGSDAYFLGPSATPLAYSSFTAWLHTEGNKVFDSLVKNLSPHTTRECFIAMLEQADVAHTDGDFADVAASILSGAQTVKTHYRQASKCCVPTSPHHGRVAHVPNPHALVPSNTATGAWLCLKRHTDCGAS